MFFAEFFTILIIVAAVFLIYKFRNEILGWVNRKPPVAKTGVLRDLETLEKYGVEDAILRIVEEQRCWEVSKHELEKALSAMKEVIDNKYKKSENEEKIES